MEETGICKWNHSFMLLVVICTFYCLLLPLTAFAVDVESARIAAVIRGESFFVPKSAVPVTTSMLGANRERVSDYFQQYPFLAGINIGGSKPGYDPGELPLTKDDYLRFFHYMKTLHSNVARVYTILPPSFYEAVWIFNSQLYPDDPMFVLHGIWTPEEELFGFNKTGADAFDKNITEGMLDNIRRVVRAVHADGIIRYAVHLDGKYEFDISPYVIGWVMGTEWYPFMVNVTNRNNSMVTNFPGKFVATKQNASPFECWVAEMLNSLAESDFSFGWQRPLTFTNWITTDPLLQPLEPRFPTSEEDWMSVDPMHIDSTSDWIPGYFVNFHAYPYSPDFLMYKFADFGIPPELVQNVSIQDPYFAYLKRLKIYTSGYPLIITEVGLPTSFGIAHDGYHGRSHGHHTEMDQGVKLQEVILEMKSMELAGVMIFELFDEWFKKSWNTLLADHNRKAWFNPLTCEQYFGLIAVEPPREITIDGATEDWEKYPNLMIPTVNGQIRDLRITHDSEYLYMLLQLSTNWTLSQELWIAFDSVSGGSYYTQFSDAIFSRPVDYLIRFINGNMTVYSLTSNDLFTRLYGEWLEGYDSERFPLDDTFSGRFVKWRLLTKIPTEVPSANGSSVFFPYTVFDVSNLPAGSSNPSSPSYSNLGMWLTFGNVLELRIPWMMIGFGDPSSSLSYKLTGINRKTSPLFEESHGFYFQVLLASDEYSMLPLQYTWKPWIHSCFCERFKNGAHLIAAAFGQMRGIADAVGAGNPLPTAPQHCECPPEADANPQATTTTSEFHKWAALVSLLFLFSQLLYAGLLRPLLNQIFFCYTFKKDRPVQQLVFLQVISFSILFVFIIVCVAFYMKGNYSNVFQMLNDFVESIVAQDQSLNLAFLLYWLSLNWDGLLVLGFALFIHMPKALPSQLQESGKQEMAASYEELPPISDRLLSLYNSPPPSIAGENSDQNSSLGNSSFCDDVQEENPPNGLEEILPDNPSLLQNYYPSDPAIRGKTALQGGKDIYQNVNPMETCTGNHAFVIACHNSSSKIRETIKKILNHNEPWQVFVADNGSSPRERRRTERACYELSYEYRMIFPDYRGPFINYGYIPEGSKTIAQFSACFAIKNYETRIDFVTFIDDDTKVPDNWSQREVISVFDANPATKCVAYALCAGNLAYSLPQFQNFEYLLAGYMKMVQARLGTALFASGAFSTWKTEYIIDVLFRHDTMHHGDDLQQGLLLHKMKGKQWILYPEEIHSGSYKIDVATRILIPTDVPVCWIHSSDMVPSIWQKNTPKPCSCGEPSLFSQRAKGWDVSRQRFLWKYLKMILYLPEWTSWRGIFAKLVAVHDSLLIINDWITIIYGIVLFVLSKSKMFFLLGLVMAWAFQVFVYIVFDTLVLSPAGYHVLPEVRVVFPLIYKLPTLTFIRLYGMFYNLLYYLPCIRNKEKINNLFDDEGNFENMVTSAYPDATEGSAEEGESLQSFLLDGSAALRRDNVQRDFLRGRDVLEDYMQNVDNYPLTPNGDGEMLFPEDWEKKPLRSSIIPLSFSLPDLSKI